MKIIQLRCFVILCETLSFSQTGDILHLTQPAISHQIKKLESILKFQLFIRTNHRVELTAAGKHFYSDAKDFLSRLQVGITEASLINKGKLSVIKIGYEGHALEMNNLPVVMRMFSAMYPDTQVIVLRINHKERKNALLSGSCDIIMTVKDNIENTEGVIYKEIMNEGMMCLMHHDNVLASKSIIEFNDIREEMIILLDPNNGPKEWLIVQQRLISMLPESQWLFSDSISSGEIFIKSGMGIAIIPVFCKPQGDDIVCLPFMMNESFSYGVAYLSKSANEKIQSLARLLQRELGSVVNLSNSLRESG